MKRIKLLIFTIIILQLICYKVFSQVIIQKINDLSFGDVFIGYSSTVTDLDPSAAKFMFYQNSKASMKLRVSFQLPNSLTNGTNSVNINFNNYVSWARADVQTGRTYVNPYSPFVIDNVRRNRYHYIWLGGQISSTTDIQPGLYTGTIILTIEVL